MPVPRWFSGPAHVARFEAVRGVDDAEPGFVYSCGMRQALALLLLLVAALGLAGCDKAGPVAPEGSVLTISASPNRIASDGISTITVTARKSSGFPVNPGTPVFLSTTRGSI